MFVPSGTLVKSTITSALSAGPDQELRQLDRLRQEPSFSTYLREWHTVIHLEDQEPCLVAVQDPELVLPLFDILERPGLAVYNNAVPEELRVPDRRNVAGRSVGPVKPSKNTLLSG